MVVHFMVDFWDLIGKFSENQDGADVNKRISGMRTKPKQNIISVRTSS